jgi:hypothetical protein
MTARVSRHSGVGMASPLHFATLEVFMKKVSLLFVVIVACSVPAFAQSERG